ncbi:MAG: hypothetical protein ACRD3W_20520, partial [Terriglobales bacterium]
MLLYMPYFVLRWLRVNAPTAGSTNLPHRLWCIIFGLCAGIGLSIKPYYFLPALMVEAYWLAPLLRSPKKATGFLLVPETLALAAAVATYAVHFFFLPQYARQRFFDFFLPCMQSCYSGYNCELWTVLAMGGRRLEAFAAVVAIALAFLLRRQCSLLLPLSLWLVGGYFTFVWQCKGWDYQLIPFATALSMLIAAETAILLRLSLIGLHPQQWLTDAGVIEKHFERICRNVCFV